MLAQEGSDLLLVARSANKLDALKEELETTCGVEVQTFPIDLAQEDAALDVYDYVLGRDLRFSEATAEELSGTGVTVTALCPGPTATGFESAADMGSSSAMFHQAASAAKVARDGYEAMRKGKAVCLQGAFTKAMALGSRLVPRAVARKLALRMNR